MRAISIYGLHQKWYDMKINLEKCMKQLDSIKPILIASTMAFLMVLTRGSHVLTSVSLPDASIVLFLLGGLFLKRATWFAAFFVLAAFIDFGAAIFDPAQGFCITNGYWGLIPAYGVMWVGGVWLSQQSNAFSLFRFLSVGMSTSLLAFVISTQTYYLFSGRFPASGLIESMQHGWIYLPSWMEYAGLYLVIVYLSSALLKTIKLNVAIEQ